MVDWIYRFFHPNYKFNILSTILKEQRTLLSALLEIAESRRETIESINHCITIEKGLPSCSDAILRMIKDFYKWEKNQELINKRLNVALLREQKAYLLVKELL